MRFRLLRCGNLPSRAAQTHLSSKTDATALHQSAQAVRHKPKKASNGHFFSKSNPSVISGGHFLRNPILNSVRKRVLATFSRNHILSSGKCRADAQPQRLSCSYANLQILFQSNDNRLTWPFLSHSALPIGGRGRNRPNSFFAARNRHLGDTFNRLQRRYIKRFNCFND